MKHRHIASPLLLHLAPLIAPTFIHSATIAKAAAFSLHNRPANKSRLIISPTLSHRFSSAIAMSNSILESPSAERNKGPIYDIVLSPIVLPRLLLNDSVTKDDTVATVTNNSLKVLELAAGCGVHTIHFITSIRSSYPSLTKLEWMPSDPDEEARRSIDERVRLIMEAAAADNTDNNNGLSSCVVHDANGWILGDRGGTACQDGIRDKGDAGSSTAGTGSEDSTDYELYKQYFDLILCINMIHIAPWEATLGLMHCAGTVLRSGGILMCYGPYKVNGTAVESNLKFDEALKSKDPSWGIRDLEAVIEVANAHGLEFVQSVDMPANNLSILFCKK